MGLIGALVLVVAPTGFAKDGDVIKSGPCSMQSDWKLKLSPENGRIEVEFEVDQNVRGQNWKVTLKHNGAKFFKGSAITKGPSGSFTVRQVVDNLAGPDTVDAIAKNAATGEICQGAATF
jgi:hypothetical protein